jgi:hypothetical protein
LVVVDLEVVNPARVVTGVLDDLLVVALVVVLDPPHSPEQFNTEPIDSFNTLSMTRIKTWAPEVAELDGTINTGKIFTGVYLAPIGTALNAVLYNQAKLQEFGVLARVFLQGAL